MQVKALGLLLVVACREPVAPESGEYALELLATNPGDVTTGVTCAVLHVTVTGVADTYVFVPHGSSGRLCG